MTDERKPTSTRSAQHACRSCKQPVDTVVERHKSMGVYVPHWTAGPCHNPKCDQYVPEQVPVSSVRSAVWKNLTGWTPH
ncbi:hypothetical protein ACFWWC_26525 [Streptomyces sp. NPDC058642]|uniref:hypothetical protein n=1 Tax=Streptomyces sp. NPDC058642 TaxID=3346572 RepID=UPI0036530A11